MTVATRPAHTPLDATIRHVAVDAEDILHILIGRVAMWRTLTRPLGASDALAQIRSGAWRNLEALVMSAAVMLTPAVVLTKDLHEARLNTLGEALQSQIDLIRRQRLPAESEEAILGVYQPFLALVHDYVGRLA